MNPPSAQGMIEMGDASRLSLGETREGIRTVPWSRTRAFSGLVAWLTVCIGAGALGAMARPDAWYAGLDKPSFTPPNGVFGPVWSVLYLLLALSAWRLWERRGFSGAGFALVCFLVQLGFNALWAPIFFGMHAIAAALFDLILVWLFACGTWLLFWSLDRKAALLLVPYGISISFAGVLNAAFFLLNG
jgi:benzodiazapine receptor